MNKTAKGGNVLWIILSLIFFLATSGLLFFMLQERTKRIETERILTQTERAKQAAETKLDQAQKDLIQLKDQAQLLARQVEEEKRNYLASLEKINQKENQIKKLEGDLAEEKTQRTGLAAALAQLRENYDHIEQDLKQTKENAEELKRQLNDYSGRGGVELKKIVVKPKEELSGKVLVVNHQFHFVVIDVGKNDGINVGDELVVYQDAQEIGKIQVEKVYDAMSTAAILSGSQEYKFSEDNTVKSF